MTWQEALNMFVIGFAAGYVWNPVWNLLKKIWSEAKQAQKEW